VRFLLLIETFISKIGTYLPRTPLVRAPDKLGREEGITALVAVKNEPWIESSLLSIKDLVDEIVVVDSSTVDIKNLIDKLIRQGLNIKYVRAKPNYTEQTMTTINLSTKKWLLRWDADLIAYMSGKQDMKKLKNVLINLDTKKYHAIWFNLLNVDFDLFHTGNKLHREAYLFSYSPVLSKPKSRLARFLINLIFKMRSLKPPRLPFMPLPVWYNRIILDDVFALHLRSVKPMNSLLERTIWDAWALATDETKAKYSNSYDKFYEDTKNTATGQRSVLRLNLIKGRLVPFEKETFGYPVALNSWIKENLGMEITQTTGFNKKIKSFLYEYGEKTKEGVQ